MIGVLAAALLLGATVSVRAEIAVSSADLASCYEWAKAQSETIHIQQEQVYQLEQQYRQALGSVLPNVSYAFYEKYQQVPPPNGSSSSFFYQSPQAQANFVLTQPLFSGFREFAAMASFKHQRKATELQVRHAFASLYQDVSNAFYLAINLETQLGNVQAAMELSAARIKELRDWVNLGKSRHSEVVLVESQRASYEAQAESLKGQIDVARDMLSLLAGRDMSRTSLVDRIGRVRTLDPEELVLARAQDRSDVRSLREQVESQEAQVRLAKGGWYPTIGFVGDYYNKRPNYLSPIHWDATFNLSLPIFSGGASVAAVRQAESQESQAQYAFELGLRQARSDIHRAFSILRASVAQSAAAETSYAKADESYRLQLKEYRLGLVSNLDVLQALNALLSAKLVFDQSVVQSKLNLLALKTADEEVP